MKVTYEKSLKYKSLLRINSISGNVVLRSDVGDLGDYRQVSRALKALVAEGTLAKISFGIYAKTRLSKYTGRVMLNTAFDAAATEALDRLNIKWALTTAQEAYNEGTTTQIPVRPSVRLKSRCRRTFSYNNSSLRYENNTYAR